MGFANEAMTYNEESNRLRTAWHKDTGIDRLSCHSDEVLQVCSTMESTYYYADQAWKVGDKTEKGWKIIPILH